MYKSNLIFPSGFWHPKIGHNMEVLLWCEMNLGKQVDPKTKKYRWMTKHRWVNLPESHMFKTEGPTKILVFYFEKKEDLTLFTLRWS